MKKTIFITSCHPLISRNILSTGVLDMLSKDGVRIVLIVPDNKKEFFSKSFNQEGLVIEGIKFIPNKRDGLMRYLSLATLSTKTLYIKRRTEMKGSGIRANLFLGNKLARVIIRLVEKLTYHKSLFKELFIKYNPDCVFATDIQSGIDIALLNEAKKHGVYTSGMVRSWDNLTSKGLIRSIPERLLVWNEIIKNEAVLLHDVKSTSVSIVGIPHYDAYRTYDYSDRKAFFKRIGGDINKKILLFIPIGDRYLRENNVDTDVVAILEKTLPDNYQILVRLPPGDYVQGLENNTRKIRRINVILDRSYVTSSNIKMTELRKDDDIHLGQTLYWSDLVVSGPSTMVLDAVYMDKPVVLFGFDGYKNKEYLDSIRRYYDYDNFIPILESGGVKLAKSSDEFTSYVNEYIVNPKKDEISRKELVHKEVFFPNGDSTKRLFGELSLLLKK